MFEIRLCRLCLVGKIVPEHCTAILKAMPKKKIKLRMPHPGTDSMSKCPAVARGEGGGDGHCWN